MTPTRRPRSPGGDLRIAEALLFASPQPLSVEELSGRLPEGADVEAVLERAVGALCRARRQSRPGRGALGVPHRRRPFLRPRPRRGRAEEALPCGHGDPGDHRLSPAGDPGRDRGDPRRRHLQGHARPAARDRLDRLARPQARARTARDLWHDPGLPRPFRPRRDRRPARPRRTEGRRLHGGPGPSGLSVPIPSDADALREDEDPLEQDEPYELPDLDKDEGDEPTEE